LGIVVDIVISISLSIVNVTNQAWESNAFAGLLEQFIHMCFSDVY